MPEKKEYINKIMGVNNLNIPVNYLEIDSTNSLHNEKK